MSLDFNHFISFNFWFKVSHFVFNLLKILFLADYYKNEVKHKENKTQNAKNPPIVKSNIRFLNNVDGLNDFFEGVSKNFVQETSLLIKINENLPMFKHNFWIIKGKIIYKIKRQVLKENCFVKIHGYFLFAWSLQTWGSEFNEQTQCKQ